MRIDISVTGPASPREKPVKGPNTTRRPRELVLDISGSQFIDVQLNGEEVLSAQTLSGNTPVLLEFLDLADQPITTSRLAGGDQVAMIPVPSNGQTLRFSPLDPSLQTVSLILF